MHIVVDTIKHNTMRATIDRAMQCPAKFAYTFVNLFAIIMFAVH